MTCASLPMDFAGLSFRLLTDRAVYWPATNSLIVADVHLGKGAAFRMSGLPVPSGNSSKDLARLVALVEATGASRLIILGDLIHARRSHQSELSESVARWRKQLASVALLLVRGNHDRSSGRLPGEWNIEEVEEPFDEAGLRLSHFPRECEGVPTLCGHVHPVVTLRDFDRSMVRVPCFAFDDASACGVLPAFGSFTGGHPVERREGQRIYITSGKTVTLLKEQETPSPAFPRGTGRRGKVERVV